MLRYGFQAEGHFGCRRYLLAPSIDTGDWRRDLRTGNQPTLKQQGGDTLSIFLSFKGSCDKKKSFHGVVPRLRLVLDAFLKPSIIIPGGRCQRKRVERLKL
jgi:hypothetical protein